MHRHIHTQIEYEMGKLNIIGRGHQCQYPGCDIIQQFCKMLSLGDTGYMRFFLYNCLHIYNYFNKYFLIISL